MLQRSVGDKCWRRVLERRVVESRVVETCWGKAGLLRVRNQHLCVSVPAVGRFFSALVARHWLRRCTCCDISGVQKEKRATISNLHSGSWVVQIFGFVEDCMLQTMMLHLISHAVFFLFPHVLPTESLQKQGSAYPGASAIPGAPEVSSFAGPAAGSWDLYSIYCISIFFLNVFTHDSMFPSRFGTLLF